jgi:hypothetical protein
MSSIGKTRKDDLWKGMAIPQLLGLPLLDSFLPNGHLDGALLLNYFTASGVISIAGSVMNSGRILWLGADDTEV